MDVSGLHVSFNFRTTYLGISNNFWCGFWVNGQLLHCFYWHIIKLSVGSSAFSRPAPASVLDVWVVVTNIYAITLDWRILYWEQGNYGFSAREISHTHKYKQHVSQQLAFFEPAIKLWCKRDNFYQSCIFPLRSQCGDAEHRVSLEQALQQTLRPIYNWPWINPLLKLWRVGKTRFGFTSV